MKKYNTQSFDLSIPEEKEACLEFIQILLNYNMRENIHYYNDIHIRQEETFATIEWMQVPYTHEWGGKWQFVDEDEVVMIEKIFPDNHIELCYDENDYEEKLQEFLEQNPGWEKTSYGTWTNTIENERCRRMLEGEKEEK